VFRRASPSDAEALLALERDASLAGLGHVFPADRFPYPEADVFARWHLVLADPDTAVEVVDAPDGPGLLCMVAHDAHGTVRQLAVAPERWGEGLGSTALRRAEAALAAAGHREVRLWVLAENRRARSLYERHGWRATGETQPAPWPPYPTEVGYARHLDA
jgi:GNAT superfamily N-acetyltransferase